MSTIEQAPGAAAYHPPLYMLSHFLTIHWLYSQHLRPYVLVWFCVDPLNLICLPAAACP